MKKKFQEAILEILSFEDVITTSVSGLDIEHDYDPNDFGDDVTVTVRQGEGL